MLPVLFCCSVLLQASQAISMSIHRQIKVHKQEGPWASVEDKTTTPRGLTSTSVCVPVRPCVYPSVCLARPSLCPRVGRSVRPSVCRPVGQSILRPSISSVCPSVPCIQVCVAQPAALASHDVLQAKSARLLWLPQLWKQRQQKLVPSSQANRLHHVLTVARAILWHNHNSHSCPC